MNLIRLSEVCNDKASAITFLQERGILHRERMCRQNHVMTLDIQFDRWRCKQRSCRQDIGLRKDTWLQDSRLEFRTIVFFIYAWSKELTSIKFCTEELNMSSNSIVDWNNFMREVCAHHLLRNRKKIGGEGMHVEIDESLFSRSKYNRGETYPQQWVFGGVCRETREVFLYAVPDRSAATLLKVIEESIEDGSIILSDEWRAYRGIEAITGRRYTHLTVNHSLHFVDPQNGNNTQQIESLWFRAKRRNKKHCGTHRRLLDSYLCEFAYRQLPHGDLFEDIMRDIVEFWQFPLM